MKLRAWHRLLAVVLLAGCEAAVPPPPPAPPPPPSPNAAPASAPAPAPAAPATPASRFPAGWPYPEGAPPVRGPSMVTSDAALATKVGAEVLAAGGNAVDAAVATAFALAVVHPTAGNLGGGGFMVARVGDKEHALDFRETAPGKATHDMYRGKDGKATEGARVGHLAVGVPGSVAGLWEAYDKLGSKKKTWAELVAPAIRLAKEGFSVDENFATTVKAASGKLKRFPASVALFLPGGAPIEIGATWKSPELAATLERIAEKGPAGFYEGKTAELFVAEMRRGKGIITAADLKGYKAKWREPIVFEYRGRRVASMPLPSSGGLALAMIAHQLEGLDVAKLGWHSPSHVHVVAEAMRRVFLARNEVLGDPDFVKNPVEELLSVAWAEKQRATIAADRATPTDELARGAAVKDSGGRGPHTTHFSVVDAQGNAVALTTTLNGWYGSGVTVTGAGFVLNNEMDDFATVPGTPNQFGLVQGEANSIAPGKRMLSSMSPTIVTGKDGRVELVLGAAGGPTILTAVFQILSNVVDFGFDVTTGVNAPRFHHQDYPDKLFVEQGGFPDELRSALGAMGHTLDDRGHIADAPSIGREGAAFAGAREPRRPGSEAAAGK
ncbi:MULTISPECIES: gamma-glutamyltransferase [Sorangium]|uniref:Glutathione hydrolase proenzyme n=1 Tax=Sorangium cellulosum (strain So ce56) TaxID=448385 RepID=A9FZ92_SORC5|nr:gamma-glutamyltransferase [Sorangium cellulosum]CAN98724.1 Gamma-glutamyltranferase [Sorangium cellulosum So ce56]